MTAKSWGVLGLIVLILAALWYAVFWSDTRAPSTGAGAYQWQFSEIGAQDGVPQTKATLRVGGKPYDLGFYQGTCAVEEEDYLQYEVSKAVCWWAGGGHELGVFEEPGQVVVRVGEVDEGASGIPGFRGNFKLVETIR